MTTLLRIYEKALLLLKFVNKNGHFIKRLIRFIRSINIVKHVKPD